MAVCTTDGQVFLQGDTDDYFSIQSSSKPVTYALALRERGEKFVHSYVGEDPAPSPLPPTPPFYAGCMRTASRGWASTIRLGRYSDRLAAHAADGIVQHGSLCHVECTRWHVPRGGCHAAVPETASDTTKPASLSNCAPRACQQCDGCRPGVEPSGQPFNAITCLPDKRPHNCCVNVGAIMTAAVLVRPACCLIWFDECNSRLRLLMRRKFIVVAVEASPEGARMLLDSFAPRPGAMGTAGTGSGGMCRDAIRRVVRHRLLVFEHASNGVGEACRPQGIRTNPPRK